MFEFAGLYFWLKRVLFFRISTSIRNGKRLIRFPNQSLPYFAVGMRISRTRFSSRRRTAWTGHGISISRRHVRAGNALVRPVISRSFFLRALLRPLAGLFGAGKKRVRCGVRSCIRYERSDSRCQEAPEVSDAVFLGFVRVAWSVVFERRSEVVVTLLT